MLSKQNDMKREKKIDSDHLSYIYLAIYPSPAELFLERQYLVPQVLPLKLVQKFCGVVYFTMSNV